jgi:alkylated DNA repair dioxygenase AlkB
VPNFISVSEEQGLVKELLRKDAPWLDKSHLKFSNTFQQEYGVRVSDAMERITDVGVTAFPPKSLKLVKRVAAKAAQLGIAGADQLSSQEKAFLRVNHYNAVGGGYMHKHMDSQKCFGPVIACCSLLADAAMVFYDTQGNSYGMARVHRTTEVAIPRRSLYFMTGPARFQWQHGIRKDMCPTERLSLTFRSVRPDAPTVKRSVALKNNDFKVRHINESAKLLKRPASKANLVSEKSTRNKKLRSS